jgi:anti-sigma factor RsiW
LIGGFIVNTLSVCQAAVNAGPQRESGKRLTLYVRAVNGTETAFRFQKDGAAATFRWIDHGFGFAVTATASRDELRPIAEAIYRGLTPKG